MVDATSPIAVIAADYDADSSRPAASGNNYFWKTRLGLSVGNEIGREWGHYASTAVELAAAVAYSQGRTPLLLGGGHSLTYWMIRAAVSQYGPVNVLAFDAHHDRYGEPRLCHYTAMARIQKDFPVALVPVGNRFEPEGAIPIALAVDPEAPWYVSVDVDYFSPQVLASVMHSVESPGRTFDLQAFREELAVIPEDARVVGADVVEWIHSRAHAREEAVVEQLILELAALLERHR